VSKKKTCKQQRIGGGKVRQFHLFNNDKPFDWQRCYCKKYTFFQIREKNRKTLIEQQGEAVEA
jgi:hypothetical protein